MCLLKGESSCQSFFPWKKSHLYTVQQFLSKVFPSGRLQRHLKYFATWKQHSFEGQHDISLDFLLELYRVYMIRVPKVWFTHQSASCSLAPLTMILARCLWLGEYQEVHRKMAEKKSPMLISIELFEINFNRPTEKGIFFCQPIRDRVWSI